MAVHHAICDLSARATRAVPKVLGYSLTEVLWTRGWLSHQP